MEVDMKHGEPEPSDKDIHHSPSIACKHYVPKYDRCDCKNAPKPGHSRCVGSRLCEDWMHYSFS